MKIKALGAASIGTALLFAPVEARAEFLDYPDDTALVSVREIGPNWVSIHAHRKYHPTETDERGLFIWDPAWFTPENPDHVEQVETLGDYICRLSDRRGVLVSRFDDSSGLWYLIACAID